MVLIIVIVFAYNFYAFSFQRIWQRTEYRRSFPFSSMSESALITFLYQTWFSESAIANTLMTINTMLTHLLQRVSMLSYMGISELCFFYLSAIFPSRLNLKLNTNVTSHVHSHFLDTLQMPMIFHWTVYISLLLSTMVSWVTICSLSSLSFSLSVFLIPLFQCSRWFLMDVSLCGLFFFPVHLSVSELHLYKEYGLFDDILSWMNL